MNHTGTHILNFALREVLGKDVKQKGSLVAPEKLRFDFSFKASLTEKDIERVQQISYKYIQDDQQVFVSDVALEKARQIEGVQAVSGETYPDPTRVVSIGVSVDTLVDNVSNKDWWNYSIEFCGGTHVQAELATTAVSILDRRALSRRLEEITKEMLKEQKASLKVQVDAALTLVETAIKQDPASSSFVVQLPGTDCSAKVISEAIKQVSSRHHDKSTYFIGLDGPAGRVAHGCFVSQGHVEWPGGHRVGSACCEDCGRESRWKGGHQYGERNGDDQSRGWDRGCKVVPRTSENLISGNDLPLD
ncbi:hypothetical protein ATEG_03525 [Aspergillus terreus NIH2624]|uniref:alanine--tRNA ligase n=1 Tax=Aspergillus terreus (strain NIH 2624 / FGSC A1156) TaxID=341663 RepID=Q0CS09_ASPTN|nr:uncharacterized protein ATEG_03525 [Aspergillus terreus NIH2624]EAU36799.1 hypothetical protein ATEG_03525 [Aspergillus terreus NIH2624]